MLGVVGTVVRIAAAGVALLLVLLGYVYFAMQPPAALAVPDPGAVLSGVTVIQPGETRRTGQRVVVEGDAIASIVDEAAHGGPYAGAYVLPGLIDLHAHFPPASPLGGGDLFPFLFLSHGVTSVRAAGDIDGTADPPVRSGIAEGRFPGPRVFSCGVFVDGPDTIWANSRVLTDPDQAPALVAELAQKQDCIKAYDGLSPEAAEALHHAARERGIPVIGHVPRGARFVDAHLDDAQHMMGMAFAEGDDRPFPQSLGAWRDLGDADVDAIVRASVGQQKALTPTLVVIERMSRGDDHDALASEPDARLLPRVYRELVWGPRTDLTAGHYSAIRDALRVEQHVVRRLFEAGATLHMGTDPLVFFVVPGAGLHRELRLYAEAGIPLEDTWRIATAANGAALPLDRLGRLEPGAPADLLVFRRDPTRDLDALASLEAVIAQGRLYPRAALEAQAERYRRHQDGVVFDTLSVAIARRLLARIGRD